MLGEHMNAPVPTPELAREQQMLRDSIDALGSVVCALHDRLQPIVLQIPAGVSCKAEDKEQECYSQLGQSINAASHHVRQYSERLRELMQSLAV